MKYRDKYGEESRMQGRTERRTERRTVPGPHMDLATRCLTRHLSDTCVVISKKAPGVRYAGRMNGDEFHVIFAHAADCAGARNTQLYRSLCRRLLEGWQVWREDMYDNGRYRPMDCLTFSGVKKFLGALGTDPLSGFNPDRLRLAWPAFAGSMPEGTIYPILPGMQYELDRLTVPPTAVRALCLDRFLVPVTELAGQLWVPAVLFFRWFNMPVKRSLAYLDACRGAYREKPLTVLGLGARQLCIPLYAMPQYLQDLACVWQAHGVPVWETILSYGHLLEGYVRCGQELAGAACQGEGAGQGMPMPGNGSAVQDSGGRPQALPRAFEENVLEIRGMPGSEMSRQVRELALRVEKLERQRNAAPSASPAAPGEEDRCSDSGEGTQPCPRAC